MAKTKVLHAAVLTVVFSLLMLTSCPMDVKTEEEHLAIITKKLQAKYFKPDGTPNYYYEHAYYDPPDSKDPNDWVRVQVPVESFDVEIIKSFDGKPEHFLVTRKPFIAGYSPGIIIRDKYYLFGSKGFSNNPFEEKGIEKGNRYYMNPGEPPGGGLAFIKDGVFVDLHYGWIYTEAQIKERLKFLRSREGIRFMKNNAALL